MVLAAVLLTNRGADCRNAQATGKVLPWETSAGAILSKKTA